MKVYLTSAACKYCSTKPTEFVTPEIPGSPNIILVGEAPGQTERQKGYPFAGKSGRLLRDICRRVGARPILINSCNLFEGDHKPDIKAIAACRESHLIPLLDDYPDLPVVALGKFAASAILGGKRNEKKGAGRALFLYGRNVLFTYHPAYYLYERDERILEHIEIHIAAALRPTKEMSYQDRIRKVKPSDFKHITIDVENDSTAYPWYDNPVIILGIKPEGDIPYPLDLREKGVITPELITALNETTELVVGHNLMYDLVHFAYLGITFDHAKFHDTMIYQKSSGTPEIDNGLKYLAKKYLKVGPYEAKFSTQLHKMLPIHEMDSHELKVYNACDLAYTEALKEKQTQFIPLFQLEMDYIPYVRDMSMAGFHTSRAKVSKAIARINRELDKTERKARKMAGLGKDFNFRSPKQVLAAINSVLPESARVDNTAENTLIKVQDQSIFISELLEIRGLGKDLDAAKEIKDHIANDDCVHAVFRVHGTETTRLTSSDPNMQNKTPGLRIVFNSGYKGGKILSADLKAQEYRIIAHITGEPELIRCFLHDEDIHAMMYKTVMGTLPKDKIERKLGKTFNYAYAYEVGFERAFGLMNEIKPTSREEAKKIYYDRLKGVYPEVDIWKNETRHELWTYGRIKNLFGRVRIFHEAELADKWGVEREAINWKIQSSGHEITSLFTMTVMDGLKMEGYTDVLFVQEGHDSLVLDCPANRIKEVGALVKGVAADLNHLIEQAFGVRMRIPMLVDVDGGAKWWG